MIKYNAIAMKSPKLGAISFFSLLLMLMLSFYSAHALSTQNQAGLVKPLDDYKVQYQGERDAIFSMIESRNDLNHDEKKAMYAEKMTTAKHQFTEQRKKDYESTAITLDVQHACRGLSFSRAQLEIAIDCGFKCVTQPRENMFTKKEWVSFDGLYTDTLITEKKACVALISSDNFLTKVSATATFKYNDSYIESKILEEAEQVFSQ